MDFWLENMMAKNRNEPMPHILVDCGYVKHKNARDNADKLLKHLGGRNLLIAGFGRVLVRIPPTKSDLLKRFRSIRTHAEAPGYCDTTHTFGSGPQFDVKHHS